MIPGWETIAAGAVAGGGNLIGQIWANETNKRIARDQMRFQERMSGTAHRREMRDMLAAGLNPVLSAGGSGASTPAGASATMQAPHIEMPSVLSIGQLALDQQRVDLERRKIDAIIPNTESKTKNIEADTRLKQKGLPRAILEGEAAGFMQDLINWGKRTLMAPSKRSNKKGNFNLPSGMGIPGVP